MQSYAALHFNCGGNNSLYAITGANVAGESYGFAHSIVRVDTVTGEAVAVCLLQALDSLQVFAFLDSSTLVHFAGSDSPTMLLLSLDANMAAGLTCNEVSVTKYATSSSVFDNGPVSAATSTGDGVHVLVVVGRWLYSVTATGDVTPLGVLKRDSSSAPFLAQSLSLSPPCTSTCKHCLSACVHVIGMRWFC